MKWLPNRTLVCVEAESMARTGEGSEIRVSFRLFLSQRRFKATVQSSSLTLWILGLSFLLPTSSAVSLSRASCFNRNLSSCFHWSFQWTELQLFMRVPFSPLRGRLYRHVAASFLLALAVFFLCSVLSASSQTRVCVYVCVFHKMRQNQWPILTSLSVCRNILSLLPSLPPSLCSLCCERKTELCYCSSGWKRIRVLWAVWGTLIITDVISVILQSRYINHCKLYWVYKMTLSLVIKKDFD